MEEGRFDSVARQLLDAQAFGGPNDLRFSVRSAGGGKWNGGLSSSGQGTAINHSVARQNARVAMQESVQARAIVERKASTIADGGLRLEMAPITELLGITREAAEKWARDVEARFHLWAKDKNQHRSGSYNFYQSQPLYQLFRNRDNDIFARFFYDGDPALQNPLQFDFLDPDQVRSDAYTATIYNRSTGNYTSTYGFQGTLDGIIRDERGRETGYRVWIRGADGSSFKEVILPAAYPGGRIAVIHGRKTEYAGQGRGFTPLAHAIQEFENLTDFSSATIKKAINQSNMVAFVEPSKDEDASNPLDGILTNLGAGPAANIFGQMPSEVAGIPVTPDQQPGLDTFYRVPEATLDTPGSLFIGNLTKGSTIKFPQNSAPGDSFDKFVDAFSMYVSASEGIPLEVVLMKFGQNYSASRATLLLFWATCYWERQDMAYDYLNPTVEMWLCGEIAAGRVVAPGWSDPRLRAAWLNCTWIGSGPPDIDPAKSAKAARDNLEIGRTNAERESRDFNGTSAADNIARNNSAYNNYKQLPWNEPGNPPPGKGAVAPVPVGDKKAMAWLLDEMRNIVREEIDNG